MPISPSQQNIHLKTPCGHRVFVPNCAVRYLLVPEMRYVLCLLFASLKAEIKHVNHSQVERLSEQRQSGTPFKTAVSYVIKVDIKHNKDFQAEEPWPEQDNQAPPSDLHPCLVPNYLEEACFVRDT